MPILIEQDFNTMRADIEHLKLKINTIKQELKKLRSKLLRKRVEKNRPFLTKRDAVFFTIGGILGIMLSIIFIKTNF